MDKDCVFLAGRRGIFIVVYMKFSLQRPLDCFLQLYILVLASKLELRGPNFKVLLFPTLVSSFSYYSYQKDEVAKPGSLLTK